MTTTCRIVIENLSHCLTIPREQQMMEEILQNYATYDSLRTQYTNNQRTIRDQMADLLHNETTLQPPGTPPLSQSTLQHVTQQQSISLDLNSVPPPTSKYTHLNFTVEP